MALIRNSHLPMTASHSSGTLVRRYVRSFPPTSMISEVSSYALAGQLIDETNGGRRLAIHQFVDYQTMEKRIADIELQQRRDARVTGARA